MEVVLPFVALAILVAIWVTARAEREEHHIVRLTTRGDVHARLNPYELAYLAGGPLRVVNTVIALLVRTGVIRVARGGRISLVAGAPPPSEAIEQDLLDTLGGRGGSCPVTELRRAVGGGTAMDALRHRLLGKGLLVPESTLAGARKLLNRLRALTALAAVFELGVILSFLPPLAWRELLILLWGDLVIPACLGGLALVMGVSYHARLRRTLHRIPSEAGHRVLASARTVYERSSRPVTPDPVQAVAFPVALYGLGELGDPGLEAELSRAGPLAAMSGSGCAAGACGDSSDFSYRGRSFAFPVEFSYDGGGRVDWVFDTFLSGGDGDGDGDGDGGSGCGWDD